MLHDSRSAKVWRDGWEPDLRGQLEQRLGHVERAGRVLLGRKTSVLGAERRPGRFHALRHFTHNLQMASSLRRLDVYPQSR